MIFLLDEGGSTAAGILCLLVGTGVPLNFDNRKLQRENGLLKAIAAQAEKVYRLRLTILDESTIPIYGEIVAMGTMIFDYEREHSK